MTKIEKLALVLIVMVLILITACLWIMNTHMAAIADDLERFKVETYDRERSLLSVKLPTISDEPEPLLADISENSEPLAKTAAEIVHDIYDQVGTGNDQVDAQDYTQSDINEAYNEATTPEEVYFPNEDYILRVITAEGGSDQLVCNGVVQCLFNSCQRDGWERSVVQILNDYGYTGPAGWISDEAAAAWDAVFCSGVTFTDFEDAEYFYAPRYCDSPWHESLRFVIETGGVRFFAAW